MAIIFPHLVKGQQSLISEITGAEDSRHSTFYGAMPDSNSRTIDFSLKRAAPIYREWSDSIDYHRYQRSEDYFRVQWNRERWVAGVEYYRTGYAFKARPVSYQSTAMILDQTQAGVFGSKMFPVSLRAGAHMAYNSSTKKPDYLFTAGWQKFPWFQPFLIYSHFSTSHSTLFRLYDSSMRFDDTFVSEQYGLLLKIGQSFPMSYTFQYMRGKMSQPHSILEIGESQKTSIRSSKIISNLSISIGQDFSLFRNLEYQQLKGHSNWYTSGAQFAYFNNIRWLDLVWNAGIRWKNIQYLYSIETIETGTYGQVSSNHPFSEQVVDLLGTSFAVDIDGNMELNTHELKYRFENFANSHWVFTAAYVIALMNQADFSTYALVWGFPRWETQRVSEVNLRRTELLRISVEGIIPVTSRLDAVTFVRQYIPLRTQYADGVPGGEPSGGKRKSFGGLLFSLRLEFRY